MLNHKDTKQHKVFLFDFRQIVELNINDQSIFNKNFVSLCGFVASNIINIFLKTLPLLHKTQSGFLHF